jgi:hypothetical protein
MFLVEEVVEGIERTRVAFVGGGGFRGHPFDGDALDGEAGGEEAVRQTLGDWRDRVALVLDGPVHGARVQGCFIG